MPFFLELKLLTKTFKFNHHSWNGRGGARGLATEVMEETFNNIMKTIQDKGLGEYTLTFNHTGEIKGKIHASNQATGDEVA